VAAGEARAGRSNLYGSLEDTPKINKKKFDKLSGETAKMEW
jgi:hypothetical protein